MLTLWYASFIASMVTMVYGVSRRSWFFMLISTITFLPISYYFLGINIFLKCAGFTPIILLGVSVFFVYSEKKSNVVY